LKNYPGVAQNATTLHYHDLFDGGRWRELLSFDTGLPLDPGKVEWLKDNLSELDI